MTFSEKKSFRLCFMGGMLQGEAMMGSSRPWENLIFDHQSCRKGDGLIIDYVSDVHFTKIGFLYQVLHDWVAV